jgi:anaerobic ribonucleoside-triphosphate reductase activating protein
VQLRMSIENEKIQIALHGIIPRTAANGPGIRFGIWVQGCSRQCPGCFNPEAQEILDQKAPDFIPQANIGWIEVSNLISMIEEEYRKESLDGIIVSGGEPFDQPNALKELFIEVRKLGLSVVAFSGYLLEELVENPQTTGIFKPIPLIDVLIDGPYIETQPLECELRGSANQRIHLLTGRYREKDLVPRGPVEFIIRPDGLVFATGFSGKPFKK